MQTEAATETRHTPGPWFRSGVRQKVDGMDAHSVVATVDGKEIIIASVWYNPQTHEGFRDAGFIAAAPEMYEALVEACEIIRDLSHFANNNGAMIDDEQFTKGLAALSKARGEA